MTQKTGCGCTSCSASSASSGISNRPGLSSLSYRIGTYDSFFAAMKLRLSGQDLSFPPAVPPLRALKTRDQDDPAIALLDAWAVLGDVLTFYQERIANEGYLRTATERRSIAALAALVGAELRPGVSASTYVAYTIDPTISNGFIAAGSKVQSVPGPGQVAQTFETSEDLSGMGTFSAMTPRLTRPQLLSSDTSTVFLTGLTNSVSLNDPLLSGSDTLPRRVQSLSVDTAKNRTTVTLQPAAQASAASMRLKGSFAGADQTPTSLQPTLQPIGVLAGLLPSLLLAPATHPATALDLKRRLADVYQPNLDTAPKILRTLNPSAADDLYPALAASRVAPPNPSQLFAFRTKAAVYGNNAPLKPITNAQGIVTGTEEWSLGGELSIVISIEITQQEYSSGVILKKREATDESSGSSIKITQGNTSASASFTSADTTVSVGSWTVNLNGSISSGLTISIPSLDRNYSITAAAGGPYKLVAGTYNLAALTNQSASSDINGRQLVLTVGSEVVISDDAPSPLTTDQLSTLSLDSVYDKIVPGSTVYIERADNPAQSMTAVVSKANQVSLTSYNLSARVTQLTLTQPWLDPAVDLMLTVARSTTVYAQNELLPLAEEPITDLVQGDTVEMGALYSDLQPGRWLIVSGERADLSGTSGIQGAEVVMLGSVQQGTQQVAVAEPVSTPTPPTSPPVETGSAGVSTSGSAAAASSGSSTVGSAPPASSTPTTSLQGRAGETTHSFLKFASPLAYTYKPETVTIYGNVVPATNGETRKEVIGSGDSSQTFQQFVLHANPLTYTSAATQSGVASSLAVYVNGIQWHEVDSLTTAGPTDRIFTTSVNNQNVVTVTFGDGQHGMRLPTGQENVQAIYRTGIGSGGNLDSGKLTLLSTRPLGAKAVTNPVISSGGADRDDADASRRNAPLASIALDRLVSVSDYASFARTFAGIGKATSSMLALNQSSTVIVSVAGSEGSELATNSQVVQQLTLAFQELGDPNLPIDVVVIDPLLLILSARIKTLADYPWTTVAPLVTAALLARFSFDSQMPGASVYLSTVVATIQQVAGVAYVVVDGFDSISRSQIDSATAFTNKMAQLRSQTTIPSSIPLRLEYVDARGNVQPSQVAYLSPDLPDTLLLSEIPL